MFKCWANRKKNAKRICDSAKGYGFYCVVETKGNVHTIHIHLGNGRRQLVSTLLNSSINAKGYVGANIISNKMREMVEAYNKRWR